LAVTAMARQLLCLCPTSRWYAWMSSLWSD